MSDFMEKHFRHLRDGKKEYTEAEVRLIIEGAVAEEREACAQLCEAMRPTEREFDQRFYTACTLNANAIRNRSKE